MQRISTAERRARLGLRHHLARAAPDVTRAASDLVGFHSSDPATVYLSARSRVDGFVIADLDDALYERRSLVRMLGMRRTMFVVPLDLAATMDAACTVALAPGQRKRLVRFLAEQSVADGDAEKWLARVEKRTLRALEKKGEATASELTKVVPELGRKLSFGEGKKWGGTMGMSTRVLFLLATEGRIVRGRPLGTWVSSQYRWTATETWLGAPLPTLPPAEARADLLRRWLRSFGPGTVTDLKWWTGWTVAQTKVALGDVDAVEVRLDDGTGFVLPDDVGPSGRAAPWAALLPALDPTIMGWKDRAWYLGDLQKDLFDTNGNAGPTVWCNGRVVGGWLQHGDGEIEIRLLTKVTAKERKLIDTDAAALETWLGDTRITPRFRTPWEKDNRR